MNSTQSDRAPEHEVPIERRLAGLRYVLDRVSESYPDHPVSLVNVARLVDQVAAARVERDDTARRRRYPPLRTRLPATRIRDFIISEDALIALVAAIRAADEVFESGRTFSCMACACWTWLPLTIWSASSTARLNRDGSRTKR